jgi:hypothetical protein
MWNEFLPISIPITAISLLSFCNMACSLSLVRQHLTLAGLEHGLTIPLSDINEQTHRAAERGWVGFVLPTFFLRQYNCAASSI